METVSSNRPYLVRALYEWITDNHLTPHILVNATIDGVQVPASKVEDGKIVLNIAPGATRDLELGNEWILCNARFEGKPFAIQIPIHAVLAVYARENGQGMIFPEESPPGPARSTSSKKTRLRVIK